MNYWRMQLHPNQPEEAMAYAVKSLAAGFIGLDFRRDPGNLLITARDKLPTNQRDYWDFAHRMQTGDKVLIIVHHFPFALATVAGDYTYITGAVPEIGVWFRHFRRVKDVLYYADCRTNVRAWRQLRMTDTISILSDRDSASARLMRAWMT